jgi:hypothetical protein
MATKDQTAVIQSHETRWHICDDSLEPLARKLLTLANRFNVHFDVAKRDPAR